MLIINQPKSSFLINELNPGVKKTFQLVRNQSADFQMLIKPSQSNEPKSTSKRTLVNDESKLHNIQKNQLQEYYKGIISNHDKPRQDKPRQVKPRQDKHTHDKITHDKNASDKTTNQVIKNTKRLHNSLDSRIQKNKTQNNPLNTFKLTLAQFKEKLGNVRSIGFSKEKNQISPKQPSEPATQKKMPQSLVNEEGKVLQSDGMIFNLPKTLEGEIDVMCQEINYLKKKSDLLEIQNKILFDNLLKIQQDRESNSKEREYVLVKLDQMIDTQKRQEDNLTFFKTIFQSQCISQSGVFESDTKII